MHCARVSVILSRGKTDVITGDVAASWRHPILEQEAFQSNAPASEVPLCLWKSSRTH